LRLKISKQRKLPEFKGIYVPNLGPIGSVWVRVYYKILMIIYGSTPADQQRSSPLLFILKFNIYDLKYLKILHTYVEVKLNFFVE